MKRTSGWVMRYLKSLMVMSESTK
jgi:hypothetical protein